MNPVSAVRQWVADLPITRKFILLCTLLTLGIIVLAVCAARMQYLGLVDGRKQQVKTQVEMGMDVIGRYAGMARRGELDEAQAKRQAIAMLASLKTNGDVDYFFITDPSMRVVMHPKRATGSYMGDYKSDAGEYVYRQITAAAQRGDGFSHYTAPKPGEKNQLPKIVYSSLYKDWGWILTMGVYADDIQREAWGFTRLITLVGALIIAVIVALSWLIGSALSRRLRAASQVAQAISEGRFDNAIAVETRDESGQMLASMRQMQGQLQRFNGEMQTMIRLQQGEDIGHRIPEDFPGDYATLARGVNTVVFEHLGALNEAMEVMAEYGNGDLHRDMRRLPGQRARLHEALDAVKANLSAINGDIARLAESAARGDFGARGDAGRYRYAFAEMVQALNALMQEADAGLSDVGRVMAAIAEGDLGQRVEVRYHGAFGRLASAVNRTADQLAGIVRGIQQSAEAINTAAGEIAAGNTDLSRRTESQAANLEETAASMEELTSTVRQNADSAGQADRLAKTAGEVAGNGGRVVEDVVTTMASIREASSRIADIIGVIDGIAFQTNILALNAAVEAARAGEQGRGFAVVASEVRSLAQRSAGAAKEIKQLIDASSERVERGSTLVASAGSTMHEVVGAVRRVTDIMAEITAASQEQTAGIEQVNQTVTQLDEMTQQNAALVEESTAAARSLEDQAGQLARAVAVFRLAGDVTWPGKDEPDGRAEAA